MDWKIKINKLRYEVNNSGVLSKDKMQILHDITFNIFHGEVFGLTGESGCGKTTLVKVLAGIIPLSGGTIELNPAGSSNPTSPVQILFQNNDELLNPLRVVNDYLLELGTKREAVSEICELLEIPDKILLSKCYQLSGGERQRVALARILKSEPEILILDEPFSAQDPNAVNLMSMVIKRINKLKRITIISVSHDISTLTSIADRIGVMYGGRMIEIINASKLTKEAAHPYSKFLMQSVGYKLTRENFGTVNNGRKSECPYYFRCENRTDKCLEKVDCKISETGLLCCNNPY